MGIALLIALAVVLGFPLAMLFLPEQRRLGVLVGEGFLFGVAICSGVLFLLSLAGFRWSIAPFSIGVALVGFPLWLLAVRRRAVHFSPMQLWTRSAAGVVAAALAFITVVLVAGYAAHATVARPAEFDFLVNWGLKGQVFWENRGIDWGFLEGAWYMQIHPEYPILLPLSYDVAALLGGLWDDRWIGLLFVAFAVSVLLVLHEAFFEETGSRWMASAFTLACVPIACSPWLGIGDGPLVAYGTTSLVAIRRGLKNGSPRCTLAGAVFLGLAAMTKNEGQSLVIAVVVAVALCSEQRWRHLARLWPAVAIPLPWLVLRQMHGLASDLASHGFLGRVLEQLKDPTPFLSAIATHATGKPLFWIGVTLAISLSMARGRLTERFVALVVVLQFTSYVIVYMSTPHSVDWQIRWSWDRVITHLALPLLFAALMLLVPGLRGAGTATVESVVPQTEG